MPQRVILATGNPGKLREFSALLSEMPLELVSAKACGYTLPQEATAAEGGTLHKNAALKAETLSQQSQTWALADDSGVFVDALGGAPGVDTATYGGPEKLLKALENITKPQERTGKIGCVLALARPQQPTLFFEGWEELEIATRLRGQGGFGYDPVLILKGQQETLAERVDRLGLVQGKAGGHRALATQSFVAFIKQLFADL